jgi:DNA-binding NarL/FixJ family response regulator
MRILLVDDEEPTLAKWCAALELMGAEVTTARNYDEVDRLLGGECCARRVAFELALVDLVLPKGRSGFDVVGLLRKQSPDTGVVLVSQFLDSRAGPSAWRQGVLALPKPLDFNSLYELVQMSTGTRVSTTWVKEAFPSLTHRETEVMALGALGLSNGVIAAKLRIKPRTVETHWRRVRNKTELRSQRELFAALIRLLSNRFGWNGHRC